MTSVDQRLRRLFAHNLRKLREERGLTLRALSELAGISNGRISEYESALAACTLDTLEKFADALGVPPTAFFDEAGFEKPKRKAR